MHSNWLNSIFKIFRLWIPLAASWLLMGIELPIITAVIARLSKPEINLAAYGGIILPISLIMEAPVVMLLGASTALSKDYGSFSKLRKYTWVFCFIMVLIHMVIGITPMYDIVVNTIIGAPKETVGIARMGLIIMIPWAWAMGYRRFHQGVLIRFGYSRFISYGTLIRLITDCLLLFVGYQIKIFPGVVVATTANIIGVIAETLFILWVARPIIKNELTRATSTSQKMNFRNFFHFYLPLAITSLVFLFSQFIISSALSRMPSSLESLAVWPVLVGVFFLFRSASLAYNEVVVSMMDEPKMCRFLYHFALLLGGISSFGFFLFATTPLAEYWLRNISGLTELLISLSLRGLWLGFPIPIVTALLTYYQGILMYNNQTRAIMVSVIIYLLLMTIVLIIGVLTGRYDGIVVAIVAFVLGIFSQMLWLLFHSRPLCAII